MHMYHRQFRPGKGVKEVGAFVVEAAEGREEGNCELGEVHHEVGDGGRNFHLFGGWRPGGIGAGAAGGRLGWDREDILAGSLEGEDIVGGMANEDAPIFAEGSDEIGDLVTEQLV